MALYKHDSWSPWVCDALNSILTQKLKTSYLILRKFIINETSKSPVQLVSNHRSRLMSRPWKICSCLLSTCDSQTSVNKKPNVLCSVRDVTCPKVSRCRPSYPPSCVTTELFLSHRRNMETPLQPTGSESSPVFHTLSKPSVYTMSGA